jgi:hypothetical protein
MIRKREFYSCKIRMLEDTSCLPGGAYEASCAHSHSLLCMCSANAKKAKEGGLFGLPILPPLGGGEHLPALLPDLPRFRPWG